MPAGGDFTIGEWERSWNEDGYRAAIEAVRDAIAAGDVYQVNLVQHLSAPFRGDPAGLAGALAPLRPLEPRPLVGDGWAVVSASPELFLARRGSRVWTMPIKGTRPLDAEGELGLSAKDAAEHVMIVDLERNDLSRVCEPGSVRWPELMVESPQAGVRHLTSRVEGRLREDVGLTELLEAMFPGGSVTGAPKIAAIDHIAALEPVGRGASMGALGRIHPNGDLDLALTIRTFAVAAGRIHLWVGGGIVWDSEPEAEIEESLVKARPLLEAVGAPLPRARPPVSRLLAVAVAGRGIVPADEPVLLADDEALLRGRAAFETLRVYGGRPFRVRAHLARMQASAARLGIGWPGGFEELAEQALAASGEPDAVLRLYLTPGREGAGEPVSLALVSELPADLEERRARGVTLISLLGVRAEAPWLLGGVKSTSYAVNMAAEAEARGRGADDAVFVRDDGIVLEGPVTNVWWRRGRTLYTPSLDLGILAGRDARDADRGRPGCRLRGRRGRVPARRPARGRGGVHVVLGARGDAGDRDRRPAVRAGPAAAALQRALRARAEAGS